MYPRRTKSKGWTKWRDQRGPFGGTLFSGLDCERWKDKSLPLTIRNGEPYLYPRASLTFDYEVRHPKQDVLLQLRLGGRRCVRRRASAQHQLHDLRGRDSSFRVCDDNPARDQIRTISSRRIEEVRRAVAPNKEGDELERVGHPRGVVASLH